MIRRNIIETMGGEIGYEPLAEGGSRFFFKLPVVKVVEPYDTGM